MKERGLFSSTLEAGQPDMMVLALVRPLQAVSHCSSWHPGGNVCEMELPHGWDGKPEKEEGQAPFLIRTPLLRINPGVP